MAIERIDSLFDIPSIQQEFAAVKAGLADSQKNLVDLYNVVKGFKDTTLSNLASNSQKLSEAINGSVQATAKAAQSYDNLTQKIVAQVKSAYDLKDSVKAAAGSYEQLIKASVKNKLTQDELTQSAVNLKLAYKEGKITQEGYMKSLEPILGAQQALKISNQEITKALNNLERQSQASSGSLDELRASLNLLTNQYDKLSSAERETEGGQQLKNQVQELSASIKLLEGDTGRFQRNVGNYSGAFQEAFKILKDELAAVNKQMGDLEARGKTTVQNLSGGNTLGFDPNRHKGDVTSFSKGEGATAIVSNQDAAAYGQLAQKAEILNKLVNNTSIGFKSTRQEARAFQEAAVQLGLTVGQTDEKFLEFNKAIGEVQNGINDIKAATKFQAQDAKLFVGLVSAVNGLVGAFGAAQAAAGLFSDESEETQKQMQKLQQLLVLITGLQQVANTVQEESGAIQLVLAARLNLTNAAKRIQTLLTTQAIAVVTADTAANEANALSQEAVAAGVAEATTALEGEAVAATEAAATTTTFSTSLIATGIGAVILAIGAAIVYLVSKIPDWIQGSKLTTKEQKALADAIKGANDVIIAQADEIQYLDAVTKRYYENQLALSQASGQNQYRQFALQKQIAEEEKQLAQQRIDLLGATNEQQSKLKGTIDDLNNKRKEAYDIQVKLQSIPKSERTGDQQDQLDNIKETIDLYDKQLESKKGLYEAGQKAREDLSAANLKSDVLDLQISKLTADEERKISLETAKVQIEATKEKNQKILSDDASTLKQRVIALKEIRDAEKESALADFNNVKNDPGSTVRQIEAAQIQLNGARSKADRDYLEADKKVRREYYERDRDARFEIYKTSIDESLRYEQDILSRKIGHEQEDTTGDKKATALNRQLELNKQLIEQERQKELDQEKFSKNDKTANDEKLAIDRKYDAQIRELDQNYLKDFQSLTKEIQQATLSDWDQYYQDRKTQLDKETNQEITALNERLVKRKISQEKYDGERKLIEDQNAIDSINLEVMNDYLKVQLFKQGTKDRSDAEKKLTDDLRKQNDLQTMQELDKLAIRRAAVVKALTEVQQQSDLYASAVIDVVNIGFETQKAHLEELEAQQQKNYERNVKNINESTATEEQKAVRLKILDAQRAAEQEANGRKQRQLDIQKATFDKAKAIMDIILNTAISVTKSLSNPFLAAAIAAAGAAQLAAAIATPLPHYKEGTLDHPGGHAVTGDGGVKELILEPGKAPRWSKDRPTIESLLPHTKVIPSHKIDEWMMAGMFVNNQGALVDMRQPDIKQELRDIKEAIVWAAREQREVSKANRPRIVNKITVNAGWHTYIQNSVFK